ncbi:hypothetical protein ABTL48_21415, partial [Acinetobacter baumannii]
SQFVQDIRVDPTNSNRIFAGADDGLYISNDGGTTYQIVGLPTGPAGALTDKTLIWSIAYLGPAPLGKSAWLVAGWYAS